MLSFQPDPTEFATLAKEHAIVPVWCEVVADTLTPVAAFANMVGQDDGFLFESVEGGERWGRYSFVGRRPLATLTARGTSVDAAGRLGVESSDQGILSAIEDLLSRFDSPTLDGLPPLHGGLVGYLGYDVVREIERLPSVPPDDLGHPDAALVVIGQFAAFDHWRQRIVLIDNVVVPESADRATLARAYEDACGRLRQLAVDCARTEAGEMMPAPLPGIAAAEADADREQRGVPGRDRDRPRSTSGPATSSRWCSPSATTCRWRPTPSTSTARCGCSTPARICISCAFPR